jgi:hypothetical protein
MSDEWKALLSAYEAGTLTDGEKKLLFEKAAADQALFDELLEAETMRAAMEGPLAKRALLHALEEKAEEEAEEEVDEEEELTPALVAAAPAMRSVKVAPIVVKRQSRRGIWVALAACLVAGTFGAYVYFQRPADVYVAQTPQAKLEPEVAREAAPELAPAAPERKRVAPPAMRQSPVEPPVPPAEPPSTKQKAEGVARQEAPAGGVVGGDVGGVVGGNVAPPAAPAPASAPPAESRAEAKKVTEEVAAATPRPAAPPQSDMVLALRDTEKGAEKNEARDKSAFGAARAVGSSVVPLARVVGRNLEIRADAVGQLYVFLSEGARFRKVPGLAPMPLLRGGTRSFGLPDGVAGMLFVLIAPQRDAELDRLADPHAGALPVRNWTRIGFQ